jgi:isoleucyl-tRNA synthetase
VFKANPEIVERLRVNGRLLGHGSLNHSYPHCWRCKSPVIFRATEQWFVSMERNELRKEALAEIERVRWIPAYGRDRITGMIENRPDWCLSRQRVWGVPIPGFTCSGCRTVLADPHVIEHIAGLMESKGADVWFERSAAELLPDGTACSQCGGTSFEKERDILDVWFESGVSYAAVLKPRKWWPADLYLEGSDQHRGWFHSALLAGVTTDRRAPGEEDVQVGRQRRRSAGRDQTVWRRDPPIVGRRAGLSGRSPHLTGDFESPGRGLSQDQKYLPISTGQPVRLRSCHRSGTVRAIA